MQALLLAYGIVALIVLVGCYSQGRPATDGWRRLFLCALVAILWLPTAIAFAWSYFFDKGPPSELFEKWE